MIRAMGPALAGPPFITKPAISALAPVPTLARTDMSTRRAVFAPVPEDIDFMDSNPKAVLGQHYDVVLNGMELGGPDSAGRPMTGVVLCEIYEVR